MRVAGIPKAGHGVGHAVRWTTPCNAHVGETRRVGYVRSLTHVKSEMVGDGEGGERGGRREKGCGMGRPEQHRNIRRLNLARVRGEAALRGEPTEF